MKKLFVLIVAVIIFSGCSDNRIEENEILWDTWGIPHIYGKSNHELSKMFGWAQMRNHGNLILKLYGESRGKSSEYWEGDFQQDLLLNQIGLIASAQRAYDNLPSTDKKMVDSFVDGLNSYAEKNPGELDEKYKIVLPIKPVDIMTHTFRVLYWEFLIKTNVGNAMQWKPGSNAWAVNGDKTVDGNAMLLANPHLPWNDLWLFFEAHLITDQNSLYGVTLVGIPTLGIAFNEFMGWTHTVNTLDNVDLFELTTKNDEYRIDGEFEKFEIDSFSIIRSTDGEKHTIKLAKKRSQFGMIIKEEGNRALALTWTNMDGKLNPLGQWQSMGQAKSLSQFKQAINRNEMPLFNVIYGDKEDNILYQFSGNIPKKNGDWAKWQSIVPTSSSKDLWQGFYSNDELPGYINPDSKWIQNANDPPYTSTIPSALNPAEYASHISPNSMSFRPQRSAILLSEAENLTLDEFVKLKHDTHAGLALRLKDEIEELKKLSNDSITSSAFELRTQWGAQVNAKSNEFEALKKLCKDSIISSALEVLSQWDAQFDANSKGAVLFVNLIDKVGINGLFETPWSFNKPISTPDGIKNKQSFLIALKAAAEELNVREGSISVTYGTLFRLKVGKYEFPGNGGAGPLGLFRTMFYLPGADGKSYAYFGESYVCATEFGKEVKAKAVLYYGNATQLNNIHIGDQLKLYTEKQLRDVWYKREQQEANLELIEKISDM